MTRLPSVRARTAGSRFKSSWSWRRELNPRLLSYPKLKTVNTRHRKVPLWWHSRPTSIQCERAIFGNCFLVQPWREAPRQDGDGDCGEPEAWRPNAGQKILPPPVFSEMSLPRKSVLHAARLHRGRGSGRSESPKQVLSVTPRPRNLEKLVAETSISKRSDLVAIENSPNSCSNVAYRRMMIG